MTLTDNEKWKAVIECDSEYDGQFFYGIKTTGIVCKPSCKSKKPKKDNVVFFDKIEDAYDYGLRSCKRCRPEIAGFKPMEDIIIKAKRIYDNYYFDRDKLAIKIGELGISQNHFIHLFRQQYNMTPVEYLNTLRIEKAKELLVGNKENILSIALKCGFGSLSTFYETFKKQVGTTPNKYRKTKANLK